MLALFLATGRGTLFIYQGQEIAMVNPSTWSFEELRDLEEIQHYESIKAQNGDLEDALQQIQRIGRDNSRTPMQWSGERSAGFTSGTPWIKVNGDYNEWNVEAQLASEDSSVLGFWKRLLEARKRHPALVTGTFEMLDYENQSVYAYRRVGKAEKYLVVCSFSEKEVAWESPVEKGALLLGNYAGGDGGSKSLLRLRPFEGRLYHLPN